MRSCKVRLYQSSRVAAFVLNWHLHWWRWCKAYGQLSHTGQIGANRQTRGCAVTRVKANACVCARVYVWMCLGGEFLRRSTVVEWRELIWGDVIWGAIGEFLQHHAPINHLFNQPETPSQHTADKHTYTDTQHYDAEEKKKRGRRRRRSPAAGWQSVTASRCGGKRRPNQR